MGIAVKKATLWRSDVDNHLGALAQIIEPATKAGADFHVVMGYRHSGGAGKATIEVFPVNGRKVAAAAQAGGLGPAAIPALLAEGDNRPGLCHSIARRLADGEINIAFFMAQVIGRKFAAVVGFENESDARKAMPLIRKAAAAKRS